MIYVVITDKIEKLNMSTRVNNRLHRAKIFTVGEFIDLKEEDLISLSNIGKKSFGEMINMRNELLQTNKNFKLVGVVENTEENDDANIQSIDKYPIFIDKNGKKQHDILIEDTNLSARAKHCLMRKGCMLISEIIDFAPSDLRKIKNMGEKTIAEILDYLDNIQFIECAGTDKQSSIEQHSAQCMDYLGEYISEICSSAIYNDILMYFKENFSDNDIDIEEILKSRKIITAILKIPSIYSIIKNKIQETLSGKEWSKTKNSIIQEIPLGSSYSELFSDTIDEMLDNDELTYSPDGGITLNRLSIKEYVASLEDRQSKEILNDRLSGKTLEEIGDKLNLTRERVRQLLKKRLDKIPTLKEDYYKQVCSEYDFNEEDFQISFGENKFVYTYLQIKYFSYLKKRKPINELLEDTSYSVYIRKCAEKAVYKDYIHVGDERVRIARTDLSDFVIKTYCIEETSLDEFIDLYNMLLEDYELNNEKLVINKRTYGNRLAESNIVLWSHGSKFRYYDIHSKDYTELLDTLNLEQYNNVEYSALKFFVAYRDVMDIYDIRNEYELHNLLKKVLSDNQKSNIRFGKMPMMEFGQADRDDTMRKFLFRCAPIRMEDLAQKYEEEYGIKAATVLANHVDCIKTYLHDGVYKVDFPELTPDQIESIKSLFTNDYYSMDKVKAILEREFSELGEEYINAHTFYEIGFSLYSGYIISNKYSSAKQYFQEMFAREDIFEYQMDCYNATQYDIFNKLKQDYEIIEFQPKTFINIRRLKNIGITKDDLLNYITDVFSFMDYGEFFTIASLKHKNHEHELYMLGFEDCFYASLIAENKTMFSSERISGTRVMIKGKNNVSLVKLLESILSKHEKIEIYDLLDILKNFYGIVVDRYKVVENIHKSSLYYDSITENVYIDYEKYFDEI